MGIHRGSLLGGKKREALSEEASERHITKEAVPSHTLQRLDPCSKPVTLHQEIPWVCQGTKKPRTEAGLFCALTFPNLSYLTD
jgi:hypothetical protein